MATKHNLDLTIINDGSSYALRCRLAQQSVAGMHNYYSALKNQVVIPAANKARKQGDKYSLKDIKEITLAVMEYDKQHCIERIRDAYEDNPTIQASGKKWFDNAAGNTYHSVKLYIAGFEVYIPMRYGYDEQWKATAYEWLVDNEFFEDNRQKRSEQYSKVEWIGAVDVKKSEL